MGFRCPNCSKDFDLDREALQNHLQNSNECYSDANYILMQTEFISNKDIPKKDRVLIHTTAGMYKALDIARSNSKREFEFIGDHDWKKLNVISHEDGSDSIKCRKCGLTAKRKLSAIQPDKRASANKIENCISPNPK